MAAATTALSNAIKTDEGVFLNGVLMEPIIDKCEGCERSKDVEGVHICTSYPLPASKWRLGACNFATHVKATVDKSGKVKINPLKASKRAARGR
ncbi:MAG: PxxKW family cysteine-rich protein [Desulfovibrio sp.]|nr:PxxKW family cysteine-rich protein [Desulfovibrio sp.]MCA1985920.1 PxxKW family cysteine-rich protein [Desulfovibrio sp.]